MEAVVGGNMHPWTPAIFGTLQAVTYAVCSFSLVLMAFNRLIGIVFEPYFDTIFTPRMTVIYCIGVWVLDFLFALFMHVADCKIEWDTKMLSTRYHNDAPQYCTLSVSAPLSMGTALVCTVCYVVIVVKLIRHKISFAQSNLDLRLCWQFFLVIVAYIAMVFTWNIISTLVGLGLAGPDIYRLPGVFLAINFSINPIIYLVFNKTIKKAVRQSIGNVPHNAVVPLQLVPNNYVQNIC